MRTRAATALFFAAAAAAAAVTPRVEAAGVDQMVFFFDVNTSTGGTAFSLAGSDYQGDNTFWTAGFSGGSIRDVSRASATDAWVGVNYAGTTDWSTKFLLSTSNTDNAGNGSILDSTTISSSDAAGDILLNPQPITIGGTSYAACSVALLVDQSSVFTKATNPRVYYPEDAKVVYAYDLRQIGTAAAPGSRDLNGNGIVDWNDAFVPIVSLANMQTEQNAASTTLSTTGRRFAFSTDGQSLYYNDSSATFGGLWKVDLTKTGTAALSKIVDARGTATGATRINCEPIVIASTIRNFNGGAGDQILFQGSTDTGNDRGISFVVDNGTATSTPKTILSAKQLSGFLDYAGAAVNVDGITADTDGTVYFGNGSIPYGVYQYDTAGRIAKVMSDAEHRVFDIANGATTSLNALPLDMEVRSQIVALSNGSSAALPQVLFSDSSLPIRAPVGITIYKPGDFNRDNVVDAADVALFKAQLVLRGQIAGSLVQTVVTVPAGTTTSTSTSFMPANASSYDTFKFDLNGSNQASVTTTTPAPSSSTTTVTTYSVVVDWKDVKIFQRYAGLSDGDINMDFAVDGTDLAILGANYNTDGKLFTQGNLTSVRIANADRDAVNYADLVTLAASWTLAKPALAAVGNIPAADIDRAFAVTAGGTISELVNYTGGPMTWSAASNWSNGIVPNSAGAIASLLTKPQDDTTLTIDGNYTVGQLNFDNYFTYTLAGPGTLTLQGASGSAAEIYTFANSPTISAGLAIASPTNLTITYATDTLTVTGAFGIAAGQTLTKLGPGALLISGVQSHGVGSVLAVAAGTVSLTSDAGGNLGLNLSASTTVNLIGSQHLANITSAGTLNLSSSNTSAGRIDGTGVITVPANSSLTADRIRQTTLTAAGPVKLRPTGSVSAIANLTIGSSFDLSNDGLAVSTGSLSSLTTLVRQGYAAGTWQGSTGISSSTAAGDGQHLSAVGIIQNNQSGAAVYSAANPFGGYTPGTADVLIKYTYYGDANLDGKVDGGDYTLIDNGYNTVVAGGTRTGWYNGDFNYDGAIDGSDYTLIDNAFNRQTATLTTAVLTATPTSLGAGAAAVPEPTSLTGSFITAMALLGRRRRVRS